MPDESKFESWEGRCLTHRVPNRALQLPRKGIKLEGNPYPNERDESECIKNSKVESKNDDCNDALYYEYNLKDPGVMHR